MTKWFYEFLNNIMTPDILLLIPHLSKELNLIGFPELPYNFVKKRKNKSKNKNGEESLKIEFNSELMIKTLTSVSFELVKQIKALGEHNDNTEVDRLNFEIIKLQKQLNIRQSEIEKKIIDLATAKEANRQLQERVDYLEKKIKSYEVEQKSIEKKFNKNQDLFKIALKKKSSDIFDLHKVIWKQFNMADQNYFPENFEIVQLNKPDFSHLWSAVKYSEKSTKEEALKEAICVFQKNNKGLAEENFSLKTLFFTLLQEIQSTMKLMVDKMQMPDSVLVNIKNKDIFVNIEEFNISACNDILNKHFSLIRNICELFEKASFTVSDNLFVCWNSIVENL